MSTRALICFYDDNEEQATIYKHCDGYPEGLGKLLAEFLSDYVIVNGLREVPYKKIANGINDLAAQFITSFKDEPGSIYLEKTGSRGHWEEWIYKVFSVKGEPWVEVIDVWRKYSITIYHGPASKFEIKENYDWREEVYDLVEKHCKYYDHRV